MKTDDSTIGTASLARTVFSWLIFPAVMLAGLCAGDALLEHGVASFATVLSVQAAAAAIIFLGERIFPYYDDWSRNHGDLRTDIGHSIVSANLVPELLRPTLYAAAAASGAVLAASAQGVLWPHALHISAQLVLALVIGEFTQYWIHRLEHQTATLWRIHAVHHSAPRLYWLNAGRFHPLDFLLLYCGWYVPLVMLGCGERVLVLFAIFTAIHGMFQHANLELRLGALNWIFSMAELHRWHHSRVLEEANSNYGANLIIWDVAFGTRFLPADRRPAADIGIGDMPEFPRGYLAQLASPFTWQRLPRGG